MADSIDQSRLWGNASGINADAPPIFSVNDLRWNQGLASHGLDQYGQPVGGTAANWQLATNPGAYGQGANWSIGGTQDAPQIHINNNAHGALNYSYTRDPTGQYWMPASQGTPVEGRSTSAPFWEYAGMFAPLVGGTLLGGGAAGGAGSAAGGGSAGGSAAGSAAGSAPAYGGVGSSLGSGAGAGLPLDAAGGGAVAGGTAAGGGSSSGSGLLSSIKPGDAIQLGGLLGGAIGGGNRGPQGQPAQRAPVYADPNQLSMLPYQPAPQVQPPQYGSANRPASEIWQQYASGLFNRGYQPPSVPGVYGMTRGGYGGFLSPQMRPVGMPPGGGLLQPQPPANTQPVQRSPSEGY